MSKKSGELNTLREQANMMLQHKTDNPDIDTSNLNELIHELQVHQVELELQNQELQLAYHELQQSQEQYKNLFKFMPLAYLILDKQRVILKANPVAGRQFACDIHELEGNRFEKFVSPEFRDSFYLWFRKLLQCEITQLDTIQFIRQDKTRFYGFVETTMDDSSDKNQIVHITISDISQRMSYQNRLQGLRELDQAILMIPNVTQIIELALKQLLKLTTCADARIVFFDPDTLKIYNFSQAPDDSEMTMTVESQSEVSASLPKDEAHIIHEIESRIPESDALSKIPIFQTEMHIGYLCLSVLTDHRFTDENLEIARDIAREIGIAIQHARLLEKVTQHAHELEIKVDQRTRELHESEQQEHVQRVFAEAMLDMAQSLNSTLDLDHVLEQVLVNLKKVVTYDTAEILLLEKGMARLVKQPGTDLYTNTRDLNIDIKTIPPYEQMLETGEIIQENNLEQIREWGLSGLREGTKTYIGLPIRYEDVPLGILNIYTSQVRIFSTQQIQLLDAFADHVAIAVKNARQHLQEQELAVLEERQHLARELHDSVSQMLFSLSVMADSLSNKEDESSAMLGHISRLALSAQAEMRLLLLELHPVNVEGMTLQDLLEQLVRAFRGRKDRQITLDIDDDIPSPNTEIKLPLYRITQEALNNVARHTQYGEVKVGLYLKDKQITLLIEDEGEGFDTKAASNEGFGMTTMRERADTIGAKLQISSQIGEGTQVQVVLAIDKLKK